MRNSSRDIITIDFWRFPHKMVADRRIRQTSQARKLEMQKIIVGLLLLQSALLTFSISTSKQETIAPSTEQRIASSAPDLDLLVNQVSTLIQQVEHLSAHVSFLNDEGDGSSGVYSGAPPRPAIESKSTIIEESQEKVVASPSYAQASSIIDSLAGSVQFSEYETIELRSTVDQLSPQEQQKIREKIILGINNGDIPEENLDALMTLL